MIEAIADAHASVKDYLGYILLDFCLLDPTFKAYETADKELEKLVKEKIGRGYVSG